MSNNIKSTYSICKQSYYRLIKNTLKLPKILLDISLKLKFFFLYELLYELNMKILKNIFVSYVFNVK